MYAIIQTGGKQYKVREGDVLEVEKLNVAEGENVEIEQVLAVGDEGQLQFGKPFVEGAKVTLKVEKQGKGKKLVIFKYKPKKRYRRRQGHRQPVSWVLVEQIQA